MAVKEHSLGESYTSTDIQLVYSTAPAVWAAPIGGLVGGGFYLSAEVQSVYSTALADWANPSLSITGHYPWLTGGLIAGGGYLSAEEQYVYSTDPTDWAIQMEQNIQVYLFLGAQSWISWKDAMVADS